VNKQICKITSTHLGFEDHGIFTAMITVDYGGCSQSIGGFVMGVPDAPHTTPRAADFIVGLLKACGVDKWEQLKGRTIFAIFDGDEMPLNTMPLGIENLPTERGERFLFKDWQQSVKEAP